VGKSDIRWRCITHLDLSYDHSVLILYHPGSLLYYTYRELSQKRVSRTTRRMCGRYALALSNEEVYDALQNQLPRVFQGERRWEREQDYRPK